MAPFISAVLTKRLFFSKTDFAAFGKGLQLLASGFNLRVSQPTFG